MFLTYNGGTIVAMAGKECVGIASDSRFGVQFHTVSTDFSKLSTLGSSRCIIGGGGLITDLQYM